MELLEGKTLNPGALPAPIVPTRRLVVSGLYRHVLQSHVSRGDGNHRRTALLFGNVRLLAYAGFVWCLFHAFVLLYEEPTLTAAFQPEYATFGRTSRAGYRVVSPGGEMG